MTSQLYRSHFVLYFTNTIFWRSQFTLIRSNLCSKLASWMLTGEWKILSQTKRSRNLHGTTKRTVTLGTHAPLFPPQPSKWEPAPARSTNESKTAATTTTTTVSVVNNKFWTTTSAACDASNYHYKQQFIRASREILSWATVSSRPAHSSSKRLFCTKHAKTFSQILKLFNSQSFSVSARLLFLWWRFIFLIFKYDF